MDIQLTNTTCSDGYLTSNNRPALCLYTGVGLGIAVAFVAWQIGYLPTGHQLNDPIMLGLALGSLTRGLLYFNWIGFTQGFVFSIGVGVASWFLARTLARKLTLSLNSEGVRRTATAALITSILPVLINEVDAISVLIWYGISIVLSMFFARISAKSLHRLFD
ncbi:MAG: hypothetical protein QGD88_10250 [Anaerolineae bacterium]|nr:hypothetical protein [Anaerolineae bacterium]MDK1081845.1 hypothetical protein [Anaerolineae bacterium]